MDQKDLASQVASRFASSLEQEVLQALEALGGGNPLEAVSGAIEGTSPKSEVQRTLQKLQRQGLAFAHDSHGTLVVWGGIPKQQARYWSTKDQLKRKYNYTDSEIGI